MLGFRRSWKITASFTLDFSAAEIRASAFFVVMSMGFSVRTCRPCWAAAMPCWAWRPEGVPRITAFVGLWARKAVKSWYGVAWCWVARAFTVCGFLPWMGAIWTPGIAVAAR